MAPRFCFCMKIRMEERHVALKPSRTLYPSIFLWDFDQIRPPS
jgi:hypothetical protein